jgi:hypothetical protein
MKSVCPEEKNEFQVFGNTGEFKNKKSNLMFDEQGYLRDVPGSREFLSRLRATPSLTPVELIRLSKSYKACEATVSLSNHLLRNAVKMIAVNWDRSQHMQVDSSLTQIWHELATEESTAETGLEPASTPEDQPGLPGHAPVEICEFKCAMWTIIFIGTGLLMENCGHGWHVIGVCFGSVDSHTGH